MKIEGQKKKLDEHSNLAGKATNGTLVVPKPSLKWAVFFFGNLFMVSTFFVF